MLSTDPRRKYITDDTVRVINDAVQWGDVAKLEKLYQSLVKMHGDLNFFSGNDANYQRTSSQSSGISAISESIRRVNCWGITAVTPLAVAVFCGRPGVVKWLLQHGANPKEMLPTKKHSIPVFALTGDARIWSVLKLAGTFDDLSDEDIRRVVLGWVSEDVDEVRLFAKWLGWWCQSWFTPFSLRRRHSYEKVARLKVSVKLDRAPLELKGWEIQYRPARRRKAAKGSEVQR